MSLHQLKASRHCDKLSEGADLSHKSPNHLICSHKTPLSVLRIASCAVKLAIFLCVLVWIPQQLKFATSLESHFFPQIISMTPTVHFDLVYLFTPSFWLASAATYCFNCRTDQVCFGTSLPLLPHIFLSHVPFVRPPACWTVPKVSSACTTQWWVASQCYKLCHQVPFSQNLFEGQRNKD